MEPFSLGVPSFSTPFCFPKRVRLSNVSTTTSPFLLEAGADNDGYLVVHASISAPMATVTLPLKPTLTTSSIHYNKYRLTQGRRCIIHYAKTFPNVEGGSYLRSWQAVILARTQRVRESHGTHTHAHKSKEKLGFTQACLASLSFYMLEV
jgi:hypothetical protein